MAKIFIIHPNGVKTSVAREQLVEMTRAGQITPESQLELNGRIIPAKKIKELVGIFAEKTTATDAQASPFGMANPSVPNLTEEDVPMFAPPEFEFDASMLTPPNSSSSQSNGRSLRAHEQTPPPVVETPPIITSFVQKIIPKNVPPTSDSIAERACERTKSMTRPFSMCKTACFATAVLSTISSFISFVILELKEIANIGVSVGMTILACFGILVAWLASLAGFLFVTYVIWGIFNYIVEYARQRAEDSIRQEDFYWDMIRQLKELKEQE